MKSIGAVVEVLQKIIAGCAALILVFLMLYSVRYTHMFPEDYIEWQHVVKDSLVQHFLFSGVIFLSSFFIWKYTRTDKRIRVVSIVLFSMMIVVCLLHVFDGTVFQPTGDQYYLCENARLFLEGDFSGLAEGGYLEEYPHQLGITFFIELIARVAKDRLYVVLICINMIAVILTGVVGYRLCEENNEKQKSLFFLMLMVLFLPIYFYISFVYGECLSVFFSLFLIWQTTEYMKGQRFRQIVFMCFAATMAVLFRANSIIVIIAVLILLLFEALKEKRVQLLFASVAVMVSVWAGRGIVEYQYELRSGYEIGDGIPPTAWIAMGMQEGIRGNGWYSEYGVEIYENNSYVTKETNREAMQYIRVRMDEFIKNPSEATDFYREKILSQWNEPSMQALLVLNAGVDRENISQIKQEVMYGKYYQSVLNFMNLFQSFLYLIAFAGAIFLIGRKGKIQEYILCLLLLGGFLFQILWEAKSRYVLFYMILLLPLCAKGLYVICDAADWICKKILRQIKRGV